MRNRWTANQVGSTLDIGACRNVDDLRLGHQIFNRIAVLRDNGDLALRLVVLEELNTAGHLRDDGIVLRLAGLEQFSNARQTAGDVAGLGSFAGKPEIGRASCGVRGCPSV